MADYLSMAKAMDELMLELIEKGAEIPGYVADDLKSGRSLAGIQSRQTCEGDSSVKAMSILESVEMNLLSLAESAYGRGYADEWQRKIDSALAAGGGAEDCRTPAPFASATRFNSGVPRGEYWIRVKESELSPVSDELEGLLGSFGLVSLPQEDGYLLLYGKKENVTSFLRNIRDKERLRRNGGFDV